MYTDSRDKEVALLKKMWRGEQIICPKCNSGILIRLHKRAKKSNDDWKCPMCDEVYRTIQMLKKLPDK